MNEHEHVSNEVCELCELESQHLDQENLAERKRAAIDELKREQ